MVNLILGDFDRTYELVCDVTGITKVNIRKGWTFVIKLKFFLCFIILITQSKTVENLWFEKSESIFWCYCNWQIIPSSSAGFLAKFTQSQILYAFFFPAVKKMLMWIFSLIPPDKKKV